MTEDNQNKIEVEALGDRLQSTTSLGIMLMVFLGVFLMALFTIMRAKELPEGFGREAFGPADYPEIYGREPVEGLSSLTPSLLVGAPPSGQTTLFQVARPPFSEGIYPCSDCHADTPPDETVRPVGEPHDKIKLQHGTEERWCLDCHDTKNRDLLRLVNGKTVEFTESYKLCGQCHGNILRDWRIGIHGKRVGYWNGQKLYSLCVHCHDPHSPRFKSIVPLPPPIRPEFQKETTQVTANRGN